jgi:hypothetical protein
MLNIPRSFLCALVLAAATAYAQPNFTWAKRAGGSGHDWASAIAADVLGNAYITGESSSSNITFGAISLTNVGNRAIIAARFSNTGGVTWARSFGQVSPGSFPSRGRGIAADTSNCYITGVFSGTVGFGATNLTSTGFTDLFVAKLNAAGNPLWIQRAGGATVSDSASGARIALDQNGNVCVAGELSGTVHFTSTAGTNATLSGQDAFVAKYDAAGNLTWVKPISGNAFLEGIATDAAGNIFVAGDFDSETLDVSGTTLTNWGFVNAFLAKYSPQGNLLWIKQIGGDDLDYPQGLASDDLGNLYLACNISSSNAIVGGSLFTNGIGVLAKFTTSGNLVWARETPLIGKIDVDADGSVLMAWEFSGMVTFGTTTLTNAGDNLDTFVCKFDPAGNPLWAKRAGSPNLDLAWGIAVNTAGDIYLAGEFQASAVFDSFTLTNSASLGDLYVARINGASPKLNIQGLSGAVLLAWPASTVGFQLQSTTNLGFDNWQPVTNVPLLLGTDYAVTSMVSQARGFFRLKSL